MKKITTFLLALLLVIPAMAVNLTGGEVLYLKTNGNINWATDNARFAMYLCNGTSSAEWVDMTLVEPGIYQGVVPSGKNHKNVIFCRMNPSSSTNDWGNKWNQSGDLTYDGTKNLFTPSGWDGATTTWSTYTPAVAEELVIPDGLFSYNEGEIAVFFVNTKSWTKINAHVWGGAGDYTSWPGEAMTQVDGKVNDKYNCYKWVYDGAKTAIPGGLIIMNANNTDDRAGGGDLTFTNGGVYDGNGKLLTTITPTPVVEPTITLSYSPETIYVGDVVTLSSTVQNGEGYTVKYLVNGVENGETWTPTAAGEYTIAANLMNGSDVVAFDEKVVTVNEHSTLTFTVEVPTGTENVNIAGTFNGWSASQTPMTQVGISNVFTVTLNDVDKETVQYKYVTNQSWDNVEVDANNNDVGDRSYSENDVVAKWKDIDLEGAEPTLFIRGTMNSWEATDPMTYENGVFTWTGEIKGGDEFKFDVDGNWTTSYGYSEVTFADEYTVSASASDDNILWTGLDSNVTITVSGDYKTVTIVVNEVTEEPETLVFTVTVPAGTENCYIIGNFAGSDWATPVVMEKVTDLQYTISIEGLYRSTVKYKYLTNAEENLAAGDLWKNEEVADAEDNHVDSRNYNEEDVVVKWKGIAVSYPENIVCEKNYYLDTNNLWNTDEAWFAAYFFNKNNGAHTWVAGELLSTGYYLFYLSQYNVPAAAPARAKAEEAPVYTHVIFTRMNPAYSVLDWDLTEEVDNGDGSTSTNVLEDRVWNQTADLAYDGGEARTYQITTADGEGNWISLPTGLEAVEADGMVYAGNVVSAEGAIEVYNLSGAVVAYGENRVDLNALAGGVYVVRCGNDVMKVVR